MIILKCKHAQSNIGIHNELSLRLQGNDTFIADLFNYVEGSERKIQLMPLCQTLVVNSVIRKILQDHSRCTYYVDEFSKRFLDFKKHQEDFNIFQDPFSRDPGDAPANMQFELCNRFAREHRSKGILS
jgi:DNA-dependent RNA polymerase auxiliary subunit epsilon